MRRYSRNIGQKSLGRNEVWSEVYKNLAFELEQRLGDKIWKGDKNAVTSFEGRTTTRRLPLSSVASSRIFVEEFFDF